MRRSLSIPPGKAAALFIDLQEEHRRDSRYLVAHPVGGPKLWVALRPTGVDPPYEIFAVTADPAEGEAWAQSDNDLVDVVPMPEDVRAAIDAFVAEHHVERPFVKRKRDRADPQALARRAPIVRGLTTRAEG